MKYHQSNLRIFVREKNNMALKNAFIKVTVRQRILFAFLLSRKYFLKRKHRTYRNIISSQINPSNSQYECFNSNIKSMVLIIYQNVQEHIGKIPIELNLWYKNCLLPKNIASDTVNHLQLLFLLHIVKEKRKDEIK